MKSTLLPLIFAYLVPITWGFGGYFGGLFSKKSAGIFAGHLWIAVGYIVWSVLIIITTNFNALSQWKWQGMGFLFGLVFSLGGLVFALALFMNASATKVVALSVLYPAITAFLFFIFNGETLSAKKIIGIGLAIVVGWLMA
jgi:uncharacterized membrane protein